MEHIIDYCIILFSQQAVTVFLSMSRFSLLKRGGSPTHSRETNFLKEKLL